MKTIIYLSPYGTQHIYIYNVWLVAVTICPIQHQPVFIGYLITGGATEKANYKKLVFSQPYLIPCRNKLECLPMSTTWQSLISRFNICGKSYEPYHQLCQALQALPGSARLCQALPGSARLCQALPGSAR